MLICQLVRNNYWETVSAECGKSGSVGQSKGLSIPRSYVWFCLNPDNPNSHEFELDSDKSPNRKMFGLGFETIWIWKNILYIRDNLSKEVKRKERATRIQNQNWWNTSLLYKRIIRISVRNRIHWFTSFQRMCWVVSYKTPGVSVCCGRASRAALCTR